MTLIPELVLFDMDGVLADTEPSHYRATARLLAEDGVLLTEDQAVEFLGGTDQAMFEKLAARHRLPRSIDEYVVRKEQALIDVLAQAGLLPNPGVCELLLHFKMRAIPAVVASSSGLRLIQSIVALLGLATSFRGLYSADMVSRGKPFPDLFLHAARQMDTDPAQCLVIEDSPAGIAAGKAAGMAVLAVRTPYTRDLDLSAADEVVASLLDFNLEDIG